MDGFWDLIRTMILDGKIANIVCFRTDEKPCDTVIAFLLLVRVWFDPGVRAGADPPGAAGDGRKISSYFSLPGGSISFPLFAI